MHDLSLHALVACTLSTFALGQAPEIIHYTFDTASASNSAVPGVGSGTPELGVGFGSSTACAGAGGLAAIATAATPVAIQTGWQVDLGLDDWTVGMHLDLVAGGNDFQYFFGSVSCGGLRCFSEGVAGDGAVMLRTPVGADVIIPGGASETGSTHVAWVYDSSVPEVRGYLNGSLVSTVPQPNPGGNTGLGIVGTTPDFMLMSFSVAMLPGNRIDDFRFYRRAITSQELVAWSTCQGQGSLGVNYCGPAGLNSTGSAARILALGSPRVADNDLTLAALELPNHQFGIFLNSRQQGFFANPAGSQGHLCLSGAIGRYNAASELFDTGAVGTGSLTLDLTATPTPGGVQAIAAGETWHFQCWYRDLNPSTTSNFTDAVSVHFQ